nr:glycine zipper 2TM domain-containing protein [uncultured Rhodoferax sp.]
MSTVLSNSGALAGGNKVLWSAIGVLGVSTLALGAIVLRQQMGPAQPEAPPEKVAIHTPALPEPVAAVQAPLAAVAPATSPAALDQKVPAAQTKSAQAAPKSVASHGATKVHAPAASPGPVAQVAAHAPVLMPPVPVPAPASAPVQLPAKIVCATCGVVESVTPVQRESANPSGAGAVAGAVLGGLVGNQFGGGDGKALATIAGVLGGSWAGNTVEKRLKKDTVYRVEVRMEDGSVRTIEQAASASVGQHVTVEGNSITPARNPSERNPAPLNSAT